MNNNPPRRRRYWRLFFCVLGCAIAYWAGLGPLLRWEQQAETTEQFRLRSRFRAGVSAPLRWIQHIDPTGALSSLHVSYMGLWSDPNFTVPKDSDGKLPPKLITNTVPVLSETNAIPESFSKRYGLPQPVQSDPPK